MVQLMQLSRSLKITSIAFAVIHWCLMVLSVYLIGQEWPIVMHRAGFTETEIVELGLKFCRVLFGCFPLLTGAGLLILPFFPYIRIPIIVIVSSVCEAILLLFSMDRASGASTYMEHKITIHPTRSTDYEGAVFVTVLRAENLLDRVQKINSISSINWIVYAFGILFSIATMVLMVIVYRKREPLATTRETEKSAN